MEKLTPGEIKKGKDILSTWTVLEILSPKRFKQVKEPKDLKLGKDNYIHVLKQNQQLPWQEKPRNNYKKRFYQIVIGTIDYKKAIDLLVEKYKEISSEQEYEKPQIEGQTIMGVLTVDSEGKLIQDENQDILLSTFAWGTPQILNNNLKKLGNWQVVEKEIKEIKQDLLNSLQVKDKDDKIIPLTFESIHQAYIDLVKAFGLDKLGAKITIDNQFAVECYPDSKDIKYPKPLMRSSFFVGDLLKAGQLLTQEMVPEALIKYLNLKAPKNENDVLEDVSTLEEVVAPANMPLAKWPSPQGNDLVLLQQAAVNIAMNKLSDHDILGINGPPGTGKTTLLRDLVAAIVCNRAEKMIEFDDPESAFVKIGKPVKFNESELNSYSLHESLKGFEILIASSNNKAVENISAALPGKNTIDPDIELNYFKTISDALLQEGDKTWGLISAVFGNNANIKNFCQQFRNNPDTSMDNYLLAVIGGVKKKVQDIDPSTGKPTGQNRFAHILTENGGVPTSTKQAKEKWIKTKERFTELSSLTKKSLHALQEIRNKINHLDQIERNKFFFNAAAKSPVKNPIKKPNCLCRILRTPSARAWKKEEEKRLEWQFLKEEVKKSTKEFKGMIIDDRFFEGGHEKKQMTIPWLDGEMQSRRKDLFIAAMEVHKAFITAAANPIRNNLNLFMEFLTNKGASYLSSVKKEQILELWASFFLVVPAISTTFASVGKMLEDINPSQLGWLLIDEAGQATPQSAVGAIMRSRKVIVTGDPLQIKPIVELPDKISKAICKEFGVDETHFNPSQASVQNLADEASSYCGKFKIGGAGDRKIGVPLLVHRRCAEPMFSLSNAISYGDLMVYGRGDKQSMIKNCLGESQWFDVKSEKISSDHWSSQEGEKVIELLNCLKQQNIPPDLCIISPFRNVAYSLRETIQSKKVLHDWVSVEEEKITLWLNENVGTIHTMQGREKEAVILVLGAQNSNSYGTRIWAGKEPNILNVAVTRAKEVIYVVGNRKLWENCGVFKELNKRL